MSTLSCDGRVVKAFDSKSNGIFPRRFESYSQRSSFRNFRISVISKKKSALSGNRTPVSRVAGENSTTEPTMRIVKSKSNLSNQITYLHSRQKILHCRGIEPRSPAWQARILPLNQQCLRGSILPLRVNISMSKKTLGFSRKLTTMGIEPTIFRFEVGRLIHWATRPMQEWKYYCLMYNKTKIMISKYGKMASNIRPRLGNVSMCAGDRHQLSTN